MPYLRSFPLKRAIPILLKFVDDPNTSALIRAALVDAKEDSNVRTSAAYGLKLSNYSKTAAKEMIEMFRPGKEELPQALYWAVSEVAVKLPLCKEGIPIFFKILNDDTIDGFIRSRALASLGQIGPDARGSDQEILEAVGYDRVFSRHHPDVLVSALRAIFGREQLIPELRRFANDPKNENAREHVESIIRIVRDME